MTTTSDASTADHTIRLVPGQWSVWRDALVRTAGFPSDGMTEFSAPDCAALADAVLGGADPAVAEKFASSLIQDVESASRRISSLSADPLLREAIAWQNRSVLVTLDSLAKAGAPRRNAKRRIRERAFLKYWQRYCGKAETIGFFGPICWGRIDESVPGIQLEPGESLTRSRHVYFEHWALEAFAQKLVADQRVRRWLHPRLQSHLHLDGHEILASFGPPTRLSKAESAVLSRCDGRTSAVDIAESAISAHDSGLRTEDDVLLLLDQVVGRELVQWDFDLPINLGAEDLLSARIAAIGDDAVRTRAESGWKTLCDARDAVAAAAGDPDCLVKALDGLDEAFVTAVGHAPTRRAGQMYAGRSLCVEETIRALDVRIGTQVLAAAAPALAIPLTAARWLCREVAAAYTREIEELHRDLEESWTPDEVPLGELWFMAKSLFYADSGRPVDGINSELERRWNGLFDVDALDPALHRVQYTAAELADRLAEIFPSHETAVWSGARIHSPDLMLVAGDTADFENGHFQVVLGEIHTAWTALSSACIVEAYDEPERLREALRHDCGQHRINPLIPATWPRQLPRIASGLESAKDPQLGFEAASGADMSRLVPLSTLRIARSAHGLKAKSLDGRSWPILEIFSRMLSDLTMDAFKLTARRPHTPRITVDRMVLSRETWRMAVGQCPLATAAGEQSEFLEARRWKSAHSLPDHVFVKLSTEVKPIHVDLSSPISCSMLAAALRSASSNPDAVMTVSEMLPSPAENWLVDAHARRYVTEIRLHIRDDAARTVE